MISLLRRSFTQVIPKIPKQKGTNQIFKDAWVTKLQNRSVISVRGRDSTAILHNTITNDMKLFQKEQDRAAIYTGFLTVKGKMMFDAIIAKPKLAAQSLEDMEYWVDVNDQDADQLVKHLKKYSMRKNIKFEDISHIIKSFSIQTLVGVDGDPAGHFFRTLQDTVEMFESQEFPGSFETDVCAFVDPRTASNGVRVLCTDESFEPENGVNILTDSQQYNIARMILGIPESAAELGSQFPLNMNLQHLNGVSFEKGCYIGQELTQRTYFTGAIRKIALPFMTLGDSGTKIDIESFTPASYVDLGFNLTLKGEEIKDVKGKKLGKVISSQNNFGIALVDLARLNANGPNHEYSILGDFRTYLWQPVWLDASLKPEDQDNFSEEEAAEGEKEMSIEQGQVDEKTGKPPGL